MQFHSKPITTPVNLTAFVTADLRFDYPAIRADAKSRYASKLDFINRYTGSAKRHWQIAQARQAVRLAHREARSQLHNLILDRMPRDLPYTPQEAARMSELRAIAGSSPITSRGNADFKSASGEYAQINWNAQQRAYRAILEAARAS